MLSTRLPPMWPGFDSRTSLGVICGLSLLLVLVLAPKRFFSGYFGFPLSSRRLGHTPMSYSSQFFRSMKQFVRLAVLVLEDALSVWTNLGKHSLFVWLCVSSMKTGTRRIMRLDELSSIVRLERRTTKDSSSKRIMHNQTKNECLPKFVQTDYTSSITTALSIVPKFSVPNREAFYRPHEEPLFRLQTCTFISRSENLRHGARSQM